MCLDVVLTNAIHLIVISLHLIGYVLLWRYRDIGLISIRIVCIDSITGLICEFCLWFCNISLKNIYLTISEQNKYCDKVIISGSQHHLLMLKIYLYPEYN